LLEGLQVSHLVPDQLHGAFGSKTFRPYCIAGVSVRSQLATWDC
jgi:hypothetical protein